MSFTYGNVKNCSSNYYECRLGYELNSQSIENNNSSVTLRLQVRSKTSSSIRSYGYKQTTKIEGSSLGSKTMPDMRNSTAWKTFGERTITIWHNSDGSFSDSASGSFTTTATGTDSLKSGSCNVTINLPTIPRASSFSLSSYNLALSDIPGSSANNLTINIDRKSSNFTHTVEIKIGSYTKSYYNVETQVTWETYYDIWQNFPNNVGNLGATVTVYTYNGSTYIGSSSTSMSFYLNPNYCMPETISSNGTLDSRTQELAGNNNTVIKGFSTLTYNGTAKTKKYGYLNKVTVVGGNNITQNATIGEPTTVDEQRTYNYSGSLKGIETKDVSIAITDTRGLTVPATISFNSIKEYFKPTITKFELTRLNNHLSRGGEPDETGTATKLVIEGSLWKENFGTVINSISSITCQYKGGSQTEYTNIKKSDNSSITANDFTFEGNNFSLEIDVKGDILQDDVEEGILYGFSVENTFNFKLTMSDILYTTAEITTILEKGQPYVEVTDGEDGEGLIDFKCPIKFNKATGPQKILWQGVLFMADDQSINLPEAISEQNNGVILIFSGYDTSTWQPLNNNWSSHFISKKEIEILPNSEHIFFMGGIEGLSGFKYINIQNNALYGHSVNILEKNDDYGKYKNTDFVLRYVIGI